uniref:Tyrosine-protein kinase receptor n=1 Tax=Ciona savignyi TaxID=51511 RepID=H2YE93_CIOSA
VCDLVDIRNNASKLRDLENCTVGRWFHLLYFFYRYSFPKLKVISGYLLLYRVYNLHSLRRLFPNLVMIGGSQLFYDKYSLVIYENHDLTELGLGNLKYIKKGGARIQNNGQLCYLDTIDWARLGKIANPVLLDNKDEGCINHCGANKKCAAENDDGFTKTFCWGPNLCQKVSFSFPGACPDECLHACDAENRCVCHKECLGGCSRPNNASACHACNHLYYNQTCYANCPRGTLMADDWQCVTSVNCYERNWNEHDGQCLEYCPTGYKSEKIVKKNRCVMCDGQCDKVCNGIEGIVEITDVKSLEKVRGCTVLRAQLRITLTGGSEVVEKLEAALVELREVGSLLVRRSFPLVSLSFLKSFRRITGEDDYLGGADSYSVYIVENKNLKDLWKVDSFKDGTNFTIGGGKAYFQYNPYLCMDKIDKISNLTAEIEDENDISLLSNGDSVTCVMEKLEIVSVTDLGDVVEIEWKNIYVKDYRTLIGYQIFYKKSKYENATRYLAVDGCGRSSWSVQDVLKQTESNNPDEVTTTHTALDKLSPYTKYAFYVITSNTANAKKGAESDIHYFTTSPSTPSPPQAVVAKAINSTAINITWQAPLYPNGVVHQYVAKWVRQRETIDLKLIDIVSKLLLLPQHFPTRIAGISDTVYLNEIKFSISQGGNAACDCRKQESLDSKEKVTESVDFEDYLITRLISYGSNVTTNVTTSTTVANVTPFVPAVAPTPTFYMLEQTVNTTSNRTEESLLITGLHHFSEYYIEVSACNQASCSSTAVMTRRTKKLAGVDKINDNSLKYIPGLDRAVAWIAPSDPNGLIVSYTLEFTKQDQVAGRNECCSVTKFNEKGSCDIPDGLSPGKYRVRVLPYSLASEGEWSRSIDFSIEDISTGNSSLMIVLIVAAIFIIIVLVGLVLLWRNRQIQNSNKAQTYVSVNPEYSSVGVYEPDEYEIAEDNVELLTEIGHGHFGKVFEGFAKQVVKGEKKTRVAVKTLHGNESVSKRMEFLKEASVMKAFNSHHVVRLLGVVSITKRPMVVMEFMSKGDLKTYLRSSRPDAEVTGLFHAESSIRIPLTPYFHQDHKEEPLTLQQKLQMCGEIADGMSYLSETKYVHRDLAARNCLVHDDLTVKIGDFGLTRDVYETDYYRIDSRGILPVRWMAPESLKDGVFDSRSDVWSYGVVLWEIATLAEQPYQGQQHDQVTRFVIDGGYMEKPKDCPKKLYDMMLMCWHYSPSMRPTFTEIVASLAQDLNDHFKQVSFFY